LVKQVIEENIMAADKQQIIDLENRFWQAIKSKDVDSAKAMVADQALVTGPSGTMRINPETFAQQMREAPWTLDQFEFRESDVLFPSEDVAVITYKVHQAGQMEGKPMDMTCADSTVWAREGGTWKCALHTETVLQPQRQPEPA
jgi:ketosteroid isomerase-like protein